MRQTALVVRTWQRASEPSGLEEAVDDEG